MKWLIDLFGGFHIGLKLVLSFPLYAFFRLRSYGYAPSKSLQVVENSSIFPPICPRRTSLITISLLFSYYMLQAHQPDISSTMLVEQKNGSWILQVRAALTAFEYEVHTHYGKDSYTIPEKFQELAISHLKEHIAICFNQQDTAIFQNAYVKLGHETNAVFEVSGVPSTFHSISVQNSSFKDIHSNQSALIILKKGVHKKQFILNKENKHTANLMLKDAAFAPYMPNSRPIASWLLYAVAAGLVISILVFSFWKKSK